MTKTKITKLKPDRLGIYYWLSLNHQCVGKLLIDTVVSFGLAKGQVLTSDQVKAVFQDSIARFLYQRAIQWIYRRPRSQQEVKQYLSRLFSTALSQHILIPDLAIDINSIVLINQSLKKLTDNNYLNDESFSEWWIEQRNKLKPKGKKAIIMELKAKGVSSLIIQSVVNRQFSTQETQSQVAVLIQKIWKSIQTRSYTKQQVKVVLARRLQSRGFSWTEIKNSIDDFLSSQYN